MWRICLQRAMAGILYDYKAFGQFRRPDLNWRCIGRYITASLGTRKSGASKRMWKYCSCDRAHGPLKTPAGTRKCAHGVPPGAKLK